MFLCVLRAFFPSLPGTGRHADLKVKLPPVSVPTPVKRSSDKGTTLNGPRGRVNARSLERCAARAKTQKPKAMPMIQTTNCRVLDLELQVQIPYCI
eukprot:6134561-Prymnesium_polylepis.2